MLWLNAINAHFPSSYVQMYGNIKNRKYDMGTGVWAAILNGANDFRCVRVTDGTDVAATATIGTNGLTVTAKYTGTTGNSITVTLAAGSKPSTWRAVVTLPGLTPEVFDNIGKGLTGNNLWKAIADAVNNGTNTLRGASALVVMTAGAGTDAPTAGDTALTGGTDGVSGVTSTTLLGTDVVPRKGMYALRGSGVKTAFLADCDDSATYSDQAEFSLDEGVYMFGVGPSGQTIDDAITAKNTTGIDCYGFKLLLGDWCLFNDTANGVKRFISPQGFLAGLRSALSPEQSTLNKTLYGIIATQKSYQNLPYSYAELQQLAQAGIDLITNPIPAGNVFGGRIGCNTSSDPMINGDNYTALTNYIVYTLEKGMGIYVGRLQSEDQRHQARSTVSTFLSSMERILSGGLKSQYASLYMHDPDKFISLMAQKIRDKFGQNLSDDKIAQIIAANFNNKTSAFLGMQIKNKVKLEKDSHVFRNAMAYQKALDTYTNSPDGAGIALSESWLNLKATLGLQLIPTLTSATLGLAHFIDKLSDFAQNHPTLTKIGMYATAAVSGLAILSGGLLLLSAAFKGLQLLRLVSLVKIGFGVLRVAFTGMYSALGVLAETFGGPIVWTITALIALGGVLYANWDKIGPALKKIWVDVEQGVKKAWETVKTLVSNGVYHVLHGFETLFNGIIHLLNHLPFVNIHPFTFAENFQKSHGIPGATTPYPLMTPKAISNYNQSMVAGMLSASGVQPSYAYIKQPVIVNATNNIIVGGKKVEQHLTKLQTQAAVNASRRSPSQFDMNQGAPNPNW